jgi:quinohemoprotein amine dehydrogenase
MMGAGPARGQTPAEPKAAEEKRDGKDPQADEGIPIDSALVKRACGACHPSDEKGRMSRISYRRTTPEGWQETVKRMVALNGVALAPDEARQIVKYLANRLGLAPEEARPGQFEVERRLIDWKYTADNDTEQACNKCHSLGRVILQRRTKQEWELLVAMHRGYYPLSDFQAFRRMGPQQSAPAPDGRPPDNRHPMEKAIGHLAGAFPLKTAEWSAWSAAMGAPRAEGRWALAGYEAGKGAVYGEVKIRRNDASADGDEFLTETRYTYAKTGRTVARTGKSVVYTGFQWRGRSSEGGADEMRETMLLDRNRRTMTGRWFNGGYDERGIDVTLTRITSDPQISGLSPAVWKRGAPAGEVAIYGANLPGGLGAKDLDFGPGVSVKRVVSAAPAKVVVEIEVAAGASPGRRDVTVGSAVKEGALTVFDKVDTLKVRPQAGLARVGGIVFPKQHQQFEAIGYDNGPDGKPDTADDLDLGPVEVVWSVEEFTATYDDDDKDFVGALDQNGLFTPNVDGPNPKRRNNTNNFGDVWVVATYQGAAGAKPVRARAHLLVTVPLYMKWDQPEVSR